MNIVFYILNKEQGTVTKILKCQDIHAYRIFEHIYVYIICQKISHAFSLNLALKMYDVRFPTGNVLRRMETHVKSSQNFSKVAIFCK